jgi:hypothetical protein
MLVIVRFVIRNVAILGAYCAVGLLSVSVFGAQQPKDSPAATPVPIEIETAQKVFISNAPGDSLPLPLGGPVRPYKQFYQAIKSWGHYQLVSSPNDADLILEISFANPIVGVNVMSTSGGGSTSALLLKVVIADPKGNVPLWWFSESFGLKGGLSHRKETLDSNFDHSIAALVDDVRKLAEQSAAQPNAQGRGQ